MKFFRLLDASLLILGGCIITVGLAKVSEPAAWIFGGAALIALGLLPTRRT